MANIETTAFAKFNFAEGAAPGTPSAAVTVIYVKADGKVYAKDDAGTEYDLTSGALGAWTSFTPTWANGGGTTTLGNGTLTGRYKAIDSKTYTFTISLVWGSTTSVSGAGAWTFTLPNSTTAPTTHRQVMDCHILDSGTDNKTGVAKIDAGDTKITEITPEGGNAVTGTVPMTWATNDSLTITGIIEVQ